MQDWNPALYLRFANERTRPAAELLARVPALQPARRLHIVDLGCGPGNSTELLVERFPDADVLGIDNSEAMLETARKQLPQAKFEAGDIASWAPAEGEPAPDLIYANASIQWAGEHEALIPRLFSLLAPGGVLAVQMPDNRQEPSHRNMREVAQLPRFVAHIGDASKVRTDILPIGAYYDLLAAPVRDVASVDVWHTIYQHPMESAAAIVQWLRGTGLKPFVEGLPAPLQADFLAEYERRIDAAYPERADGKRLLAFPRLFMVAQRKS
ncbi:trans-aconitate 2-methyltransferase [Comamonas sp. Y6]|uniref:Trans-aconitate 2-methyltransferase n=1 Tax=Comamonas resistens TaxID=3046670 RepID=A0ABY8SS60_9BURK|nr:trans-aconitate 2-methyltransferase [Comamonas resistens]MDL5038830.1 trans-aconitate 2-methyltransferase [Comamonas resistens]WHS64116.1 trans-aconitate 2-methyltransferase [Comamonas resistens]